MKSPRAVATAVVLLLVGGVLAMAGISKLLERNEFRATAAIQVPGPPATSSGPYFLLTEFETIQSPPVLSNVIASLRLNEWWGKKYNHGRILSEFETEQTGVIRSG